MKVRLVVATFTILGLAACGGSNDSKDIEGQPDSAADAQAQDLRQDDAVLPGDDLQSDSLLPDLVPADETETPDTQPDLPAPDLLPDVPEDVVEDLGPDLDTAEVEEPDLPVGECTADAAEECVALHGEAPLCQQWTCPAGTCVVANVATGVPCDDADPCTLDDQCDGNGLCTGLQDDCDDGEVCTEDYCEPGVGCQHDWLSPQPCQDGQGNPGTMECIGGGWGDCVPFTPCEVMVNDNDNGTVNPFIFPAREGEFYVSWVGKADSGSDMKLAWVDPGMCGVSAGPFTVNDTPGGVYYWGAQWAWSDGSGNFYAVWEAASGLGELGFAASESGTDFLPAMEAVSTSQNGSDPTLAVVGPGSVYVGWTGYNGQQYDPYFTANSDVFGGGAFSQAVQVHSSPVQDDQVAMVVGDDGTIYMCWQSFGDGTDAGGNMYVARSQDQGATWSDPVIVNDVLSEANVGKATFLAWGGGRLYVVWSDTRSDSEGDIYLDSSTDGLTWGTDVMVNDDTYRWQQDPSVVVGKGPGCNGTVYVVWQDLRSNDGFDVYGAKSVDGGATFSPNIMLNITTAEDQMNPAIAVDDTCVVGVTWRDSSTNDSFDIGVSFLPVW